MPLATIIDHFQRLFSSTFVTILSPIAGASVGIASLYEKIIPPLTILSLVTGIVLGILSYRLKVKRKQKDKTNH